MRPESTAGPDRCLSPVAQRSEQGQGFCSTGSRAHWETRTSTSMVPQVSVGLTFLFLRSLVTVGPRVYTLVALDVTSGSGSGLTTAFSLFMDKARNLSSNRLTEIYWVHTGIWRVTSRQLSALSKYHLHSIWHTPWHHGS